MKILIATHNKHKLTEMARILSPMGYEVVTDTDIGIELTDVEETGTTFMENARIKSGSGCKESGLICIADDSGLCVDALGGEPGVYSARYSGVHGDDEANNQLLLKELENVAEPRTARYACAMALVRPGHKDLVARGECEGYILREYRGTGGFGYDPLFLSADFDKTFAEATLEEKNAVSHRARAIHNVLELLK